MPGRTTPLFNVITVAGQTDASAMGYTIWFRSLIAVAASSRASLSSIARYSTPFHAGANDGRT